MREKLNNELKLDIAILILATVAACVFIGCIIVIALNGQPALEILAQCTPWAILVAVSIFLACSAVWFIKREVNIAFNIEEGKRDIMKQEYEERLERLMTQGTEDTSKRKTNGTTRKR